MKILFLCVENAGRSQMAEAFAKAAGVEAFSAGSRPAQAVNPAAVAAMRERGIEIGGNKPKGIGDLPAGAFDVAVTMGCGDACPLGRAARTIDWNIPDPKGQPVERVREIRDLIERQVRDLLSSLPTA